MVAINRTTFFDYARKAPLGGRLTQEQVEGIECILDECDRKGVSDLRHIAYILATAFHETGGRMQPVREGFAKSDASARRIIAKYKYGKPDATSTGRPAVDTNGNPLPKTGHVYYGRGHVQLTWAENYYRMGEILNIDLYNNPDLALDPKISAKILVEGMIRGESLKGDFTGKSLEDYFNSYIDDPVGARRIINGQDKAPHIADNLYVPFLGALEASSLKTAQPEDVKPENAEPDKPNLLTDKTTIGAISAVASSGAAGVFTAVDSPWALAAFGLVLVFAILFFTGRLQIVRKAGA